MTRTLVAFCCSVLLAPYLPADDAPKRKGVAEPSSTTVPMEILKSKHIAVQVKVNGKGPYRVIFDTGSPVTLFSNKVAQEAQLLSKEQARMPALFGTRGQVTARTVEVGDITVKDMPVMIMDHPAIKAASKFLGPLDGIVGFPFFSRYRATFDYQKSELTFVPVNYQGVGGDLTEMMMVMMMEKNPKPPLKIQSASTLWGFTPTRDKNDNESGVVVTQVRAGSAAAASGLKDGDRLLVLDGTWTDSLEDCYRAAAGVEAGRAVMVKIRRGDQEMELTITPRPGL